MPNKNKKNLLRKTLAALSIFAASAFSFALVYTVFAGDVTPPRIIELTNRARMANGLATLSENPKLSQAARSKAQDMLKNDYFAHTSPSGRDPWYWMKKEGYGYKAAGENLAINFTDAQEQQSAWMKSQTHRANILNANYKEIGVAVVEGKIDGQNSIVTVQMFGAPLYAAADQVKTITSPTQKAPVEIKGMETVVEEADISDIQNQNVPEIVPVFPTENVALKNVITASPVVLMEWIDIATLVVAAILILVAFATPMAFIAVAYELLITGIRTKSMVETEDSNNHGSDVLEYHLKI